MDPSWTWQVNGLLRAQSENFTMVGSTEDPKDGKAVAGSIFTAVIVYVVCGPSPGLHF